MQVANEFKAVWQLMQVAGQFAAAVLTGRFFTRHGKYRFCCDSVAVLRK